MSTSPTLAIDSTIQLHDGRTMGVASEGREANLEEALSAARPWGFQVEQISFEKLFVWHGEQDRIMPVAPVRLLAKALPHCTATFYPDEGHFSTVANHSQDILHTLSVKYSPEEVIHE